MCTSAYLWRTPGACLVCVDGHAWARDSAPRSGTGWWTVDFKADGRPWTVVDCGRSERERGARLVCCFAGDAPSDEVLAAYEAAGKRGYPLVLPRARGPGRGTGLHQIWRQSTADSAALRDRAPDVLRKYVHRTASSFGLEIVSRRGETEQACAHP